MEETCLNMDEQHEFITSVISQIAAEKNKSFTKIKRLMFVKQNAAVINRFWEIVNHLLPFHPFVAVGICLECGALKFREESYVTSSTEEDNYKAGLALK
jgi:hypothetical protein